MKCNLCQGTGCPNNSYKNRAVKEKSQHVVDTPASTSLAVSSLDCLNTSERRYCVFNGRVAFPSRALNFRVPDHDNEINDA